MASQRRPEGREQIPAIVPAGRLGTQEEVGELIAFLVFGTANVVTGQTVFFTGGWPEAPPHARYRRSLPPQARLP
jgi:NAD(P)-dependent dehydrogenase (short-subunit alcohol dehydrogenase family)